MPPSIETFREAVVAGDVITACTVLADALRDGDTEQAPRNFEAICATLEANPDESHAFGVALREHLADAETGRALVESGIPPERSFTSELIGRLIRRFLPDLDGDGDLLVGVRTVFTGSDDHLRLELIPVDLWVRFFTAIGTRRAGAGSVGPELETAIRTLAHHIGSLGMLPEFTRRLPHLADVDSPFLALTDRVLAYIRSYVNEIEGDEPELYEASLATVARCREEVILLRATKSEHGTSLALTGMTFRLHELLDRLELLLGLTRPERPSFDSMARLLCEIVRAEKTRNHIGPHLKARADLLAFQVVEHAARKGSKYITSGRKEYWAFFAASLGGGFLVSVFAFFKTAMGDWDIPLGVRGLLYGVNYSACFILIYLTGAALATKQPAMTANTVAQALGEKGQRHLEQLESLIVRVWRSQFVSFAGNLSMALPAAYLWSLLFFRAEAQPIVTEVKAGEMLQALHPWQSGTVFFAAVAGLYLFLAGLLSGWVDNRNRYAHLPERIARHRLLNRVVGKHRAESIATYIDNHLGALLGNVFLGFALGSTGTLGEILGLPLDIRHVAFAAAELGTSVEVVHPGYAAAVVWPIVVGVALIGLVNFLVSFGLSMITALESRNITWRETSMLARRLVSDFAHHPIHWFYPPAKEGEVSSSPRRA